VAAGEEVEVLLGAAEELSGAELTQLMGGQTVSSALYFLELLQG
jgi:hypothetical protein